MTVVAVDFDESYFIDLDEFNVRIENVREEAKKNCIYYDLDNIIISTIDFLNTPTSEKDHTNYLRNMVLNLMNLKEDLQENDRYVERKIENSIWFDDK